MHWCGGEKENEVLGVEWVGGSGVCVWVLMVHWDFKKEKKNFGGGGGLRSKREREREWNGNGNGNEILVSNSTGPIASPHTYSHWHTHFCIPVGV